MPHSFKSEFHGIKSSNLLKLTYYYARLTG